ncbi:MAG: PepSY-associated TM helix domain-containing protein [Heyndrickxia sp.]
MRKTRKIHYWIGIISCIFLFIESVSGIYLYFQEKGRENSFGDRQAFFQQNRGNFQNLQGSSSNSSDSSSSQNGQSFSNGQQPSFNRGQMNLNRQGQGSNSFGMTLRKLHSGIVGLIAGIGMLIMTGTGLVLAVIIGKANRKRKKKEAVQI